MQRRLLIVLGLATVLAIISPAVVVAFSVVVCSAGDNVPTGCAQGSGAALGFASFLFSLGLFLWVVTTLFGILVIARKRQWGWLALIALTGPIGATLYGLFIIDNAGPQPAPALSAVAPRPAGAVASALFDKTEAEPATADRAPAPETIPLPAMPDEPTTEPSRADGGEPASPEAGA